MTTVQAVPRIGTVLFDARGRDRTLRLSWHDESDALLVSTWRGRTCVGTCQLARDDVARLIGELADGLARRPDTSWSAPTYDRFRRRWFGLLSRRRARPVLRVVRP